MKKIKSLIVSSDIVCRALNQLHASEVDIVTSITGTTNYISKGMTQTNDKSAVFVESTLSYTRFLYPNSNDLATVDEASIEVVYPVDKLFS